MKLILEAYLNTPSGCDGGNIAGNNWIFAIEHGGKANLSDYDNLKIDHEHGAVPDDEVAKFIDAYPFNQRIAKFEAIKHGWAIEDYLAFSLRSAIFTRNSQYYKGNIGGLQFQFDDQKSYEEIGSKIGIQTKEELKSFEIEIREKMFQRWTIENNPNCIICVGTSDASRFIRAFSDRQESSECWSNLEGFNYYSEIIREGKTAFFILPHPTARFGNGMTNDHRIEIYAKMVRSTMLNSGLNIY